MNRRRKVLLACRTWSSEESIHAWKFLKSHVLQGRDGLWQDELVVVHIASKKDKDKERWDQGGAVIPSLQTALSNYKFDVFDLEGDPGPLLIDIANKEQADIVVLASRGRNAMRKAMLGSITEFVMNRVNCACLVVKAQVGAGDTYRMKTAAQPQSVTGAAQLQAGVLQPPRAHSPANSPLFRLGSRPGTTPFNRRVAIAYDTTASGRFLLKWVADNILEPGDNVFVVRAVPKMRRPGTSFADKTSVQRLAGDALAGQGHVTPFNLTQQQGMARGAVINFASKEAVDLLVIGLYKNTTRRKGLALRGNAVAIANRCACPCLVVPMTEPALVACVKAADLELAAAEEEELASGSESDSDESDSGVATPTGAAAAAAAGSPGAFASSSGHHQLQADGTHDEGGGAGAAAGAAAAGEQGGGAGSPEPLMRGTSAIKQLTAPLEAFFKRRGSALGGGATSVSDAGGGGHAGSGGGADGRRAALLAALQGGSSSLAPGRYVLEVDGSGAVKAIRPHGEKHHLHSMHTASSSAPGAVHSGAGGAAAAGAAAGDADAAAGAAAAAAAAAASGRSSIEGPGEEGGVRSPGSAMGGGAGSDEAQQLQELLQQKDAEIAALQQQLQEVLAASAASKSS